MGIRERHEREREHIRRAILDAARDLFVAEGYQNISLRKIAERIEYSPAAIYSYFPSKDDIFFALAEEGFQLLSQMAAAQPSHPDPLETLRSKMWAFYAFSKAHAEYFALMFLDRSVPRIGAHYGQFGVLIELKRQISELIDACVRAGYFAPALDPHAAVRVLTASLLGAAGTRIFGRLTSGEDCDALARDVLETSLAGLRAGTVLTFRAAGFPCYEPQPEVEPTVAAEEVEGNG